MKKLIVFLSLALIFLNASSVWAMPEAVAGEHPTLSLPAEANSSNIVHLGFKKNPKGGKDLEGFALINRDKGGETSIVQPALSTSGSKISPSNCYGFDAPGAKWKSAEPVLINPTNLSNLDTATVAAKYTNAIFSWEDAADGRVGNNKIINILGDVTTTTLSSAVLDGQNEVYFAGIDTPGVIAVTIVWGYFSNPAAQNQLVEYDQVFDDVHFQWSLTGEANKMDFANIATHELGHALGLIDLYNPACLDQTMYGYSTYGETKKTTLDKGDIKGISTLY